jgi:hypothetical protein
MGLHAAVGHAQAIDGREASLQATHLALNRLGTLPPSMGFVVASHLYQAREVANGLSGLLGDVPVIGFSAPASLTNEGQHPHSVAVGILSGDDIEARSHWISGYAQSSREAASELIKLLQDHNAEKALFLSDGFNGDAEQLCETLSGEKYHIAGGLSSGDLHSGNTFQIAGMQTGSGALAALTFKGKLHVGIGAAHGWDPVGTLLRVTRSRGFWVRTLNSKPSSETYANLFGYPAREWGFPPLSHLARLYPLGIERGEEITIRAPIRVEADGSFRMNAPVHEGTDAFVLVGNRLNCQKAAEQAAQQALRDMNGHKPAFALVLVDLAWQMLLKAYPGIEVSAVQSILGDNIPILGGYTLGQITPPKEDNRPHFLNQHILVIVFGGEE